jgi:hypothetical protein
MATMERPAAPPGTPTAGRAATRLAEPPAAPAVSVVLDADGEGASIEAATAAWSRTLAALGEPFEVLTAGGAPARGEHVLLAPAAALADEPALRGALDLKKAEATYSYFPGRPAADLVAGYRTARPGETAGRRLARAVHRWLGRVLFRTWLRDLGWVVLCRRSLLEEIPTAGAGPAARAEIVVRARRAGLRIRQLPWPAGEGAPGPRPADLLRVWVRTTSGARGPAARGSPAPRPG